tara:strand:- start:1096 stop:1365 length:270 start_codon:yes stop_codon:yes gene_type:complete
VSIAIGIAWPIFSSIPGMLFTSPIQLIPSVGFTPFKVKGIGPVSGVPPHVVHGLGVILTPVGPSKEGLLNIICAFNENESKKTTKKLRV